LDETVTARHVSRVVEIVEIFYLSLLADKLTNNPA